jgi:hypothetical protein
MGFMMYERWALTREVAVRYCKANKAGKKLILDEFTQIAGCHRKYAITLLVHEGKRRLVRMGAQTIQAEIRPQKPFPKELSQIYGDAVWKALARLWEQFNYQYSKLLAPFLNANIDVIAADTPMDGRSGRS